MDQFFEFPRLETKKGRSSSRIFYRACSCLLVNQFNMVKNMVTERVIVESFYAPLSHEEIELLIFSNEVQTKTSEELEFDDLDERYFFFLKSSI